MSWLVSPAERDCGPFAITYQGGVELLAALAETDPGGRLSRLAELLAVEPGLVELVLSCAGPVARDWNSLSEAAQWFAQQASPILGDPSCWQPLEEDADPPRSSRGPQAQKPHPLRLTSGTTAKVVAQRRIVRDAALAASLPRLVGWLLRASELEEDFHGQLEAEKLASLKELAYGASHEINNPLTNISLRAQSLLKDETDEERRRKLAGIHTQAMRAFEMIADLMLFARPPELEPEDVRAADVVQQAITANEELAAEQGTALRAADFDEGTTLHADPVQLTVALGAVIKNSLEAIGAGGWVEVAVSADPQVAITVRDSGPGISEDVRRHLFDPFYSGREAGRGLGFGLSKAWRIITEHGGTITVDSPAVGGTAITLRLPKSVADHS